MMTTNDGAPLCIARRGVRSFRPASSFLSLKTTD
jgi:hypothetical protein